MIDNEIRKVEVNAVIKSFAEPDEKQLASIKSFLEDKYKSAIILSFEKDESVKDGFRIEVGKAA